MRYAHSMKNGSVAVAQIIKAKVWKMDCSIKTAAYLPGSSINDFTFDTADPHNNKV